MPKRIMPDHPIYVAPRMLGKYVKGSPIVLDERNGNTIDPDQLHGKIIIYQRQVEGWFLEPAEYLLKQMYTQAGFVVLSICLSYLEGVQQYKEGSSSTNNSKKLLFARISGCFLIIRDGG